MDEKKEFPYILAIGAPLIIVALVWYAGFMKKPVVQPVVQEQAQNSPSPSAPVAMVGAKAYENRRYGVSFQYPSTLEEVFHDAPLFTTGTLFTDEFKKTAGGGLNSIYFAVGSYDKVQGAFGLSVPSTVTTVDALKDQLVKNCAGINKVLAGNNPDGLAGCSIDKTEVITTQAGVPGLLVDSSGEGGSYRTIYFLNDGKTYFFNSIKAPLGDDDLLLQIAQTFNFLPSSPTTCVDDPNASAVITSITPTSASVGTQIQIHGCNFHGFESDKSVQIINSNGVGAHLTNGEAGSTSKLIKATLKATLCTIDTSASGLPCPKTLALTPGVYKIYAYGASYQNSNEATFTITP